jgi:type IX secretion system PorP/SprF family membrane protein
MNDKTGCKVIFLRKFEYLNRVRKKMYFYMLFSALDRHYQGLKHNLHISANRQTALRSVLYTILIVSFYFTTLHPSRAQLVPYMTQYMFHQMAYNPGYAGNCGGICLNGLVREQWMGFKEYGDNVYPQTILFTLDAPVSKIHGGLGGSITSDRVGYFNNIYVKAGYAYRGYLGAGEFGAGAQVSMINYQIDFAKFGDHIIDPNDPVLTDGEASDLTVDFDLGLYYEVTDKYYVGLSASNLVQTKAKNTAIQGKRTFYLTGGYNWVIPNHPQFELKPSAFILADLAAFQVNISALLAYNNKFYGGLEYRYQDAVAILAGLYIKGIRVGLSYDINTSKLTSFNSGTIEVSLGYCFRMKLEKMKMRYKNTRFL